MARKKTSLDLEEPVQVDDGFETEVNEPHPEPFVEKAEVAAEAEKPAVVEKKKPEEKAEQVRQKPRLVCVI